MRVLTTLLAAFLCLLPLAMSAGQDPGAADTVKLVGGPLRVGESVPLHFTIVNDYEVSVYSLGFITTMMDGGFAIWDSVVYVGRMADPSVLPLRIDKFSNGDTQHGVSPDTLLRGADKTGSNGLLAGNDIVAEIYFTGLSEGYVAIDSGFFPPAGYFIFGGPGSTGGYTPQFVCDTVEVVSGPLPPTVTVSENLVRTVAGSSISVDVTAASPLEWPVSLSLTSVTDYDDETVQPNSSPSLGSSSPTALTWTPGANDVGIWVAEITACDTSGACVSTEIEIQVVAAASYLLEFDISQTDDAGTATGLVHGEFDDDAYPEVFITGVTNYYTMPAQLYDFELPDALTELYEFESPGYPGYGLQLGYFDADDYLDACFMHAVGTPDYKLTVLLGDGDGGFELSSADNDGHVTRQSALLELSGDGILDYACQFDNIVYFYRGLGDAQFVSAGQITVGETVYTLNSADFNNDGKDDLAVGGANNLMIWLQGNTGQFSQVYSYPQSYGSTDIEVTNRGSDFNADDVYDLCISTPSVGGQESELVVYLGNGNGSFDATMVRTVKGQVFGNTVGDFNGDGDLDLAFVNGARRYLSIMYGDGDGSFSNEIRIPIPATAANLVDCTDFDLDGDLDLVLSTANFSEINSLILLLNQENPRGYAAGRVGIDAKGNCDLQVVSASGKVFNRLRNTMPAGDLYRANLDGDVILDQRAAFGVVEEGRTLIQAEPRPGQTRSNDFSLSFLVDNELRRLAHHQTMPAEGCEFPVFLAGGSEVSPASGFFSQANPPSFLWPGSGSFDFQLATDLAFTQLVADLEVEGNSYSYPEVLTISDTTSLYWRFKPAGAPDYDGVYALNLVPSAEVSCGDANGDGVVNVTDAVYLIMYIFGEGPAPATAEAGDPNCSGTVNITDAVYLIQYIFAGGPSPCSECP